MKKNMNEKEFIDELMKNLNLNPNFDFTKKATKEISETFVKTLFDSAKEHGGVTFQNEFKVEVVERKERIGQNPRTQEKIKIPAKKVFKVEVHNKLNSTI